MHSLQYGKNKFSRIIVGNLFLKFLGLFGYMHILNRQENQGIALSCFIAASPPCNKLTARFFAQGTGIS